MKTIQNLYRRDTTRVSWHSYNGGLYFVTICTKNKIHYFGHIDYNPNLGNNQMSLSPLGQYMTNTIIETNTIREKQGISIPLFTVMPNHIHLLVQISSDADTSIPNHFGTQSNNLASTIRGIKSTVTSHAKKFNLPFAWQPNYHEHIIRDQTELNLISTYIESNIANWNTDCYH